MDNAAGVKGILTHPSENGDAAPRLIRKMEQGVPEIPNAKTRPNLASNRGDGNSNNNHNNVSSGVSGRMIY